MFETHNWFQTLPSRENGEEKNKKSMRLDIRGDKWRVSRSLGGNEPGKSHPECTQKPLLPTRGNATANKKT
jgi:hypothetical protein